uniref:GST C-terminal domain-containing protein n=1 Tax=Heterorhabditis bacteriophora TaxID=37862 RepID=A0A1I7XE49_HETBA
MLKMNDSGKFERHTNTRLSILRIIFDLGFLVGDSVTWPDLMLAEHVATQLGRMPEFVHTYPEIKAHMQKVRSIKMLKEWIESRPATKF